MIAMTNRKAANREIEEATATALKERGYTRIRGIFLKPLAEGVKGWVGLLRARQRTKNGEIQITPNIGVRHERIHELINRLKPPKEPNPVPTATTHIGYLMPEKTANICWLFGQEPPPDEVARGLADYIVRYGEPWMQERVPQEAIIEQLRFNQRGSRPWYPERLPVALLLAGCPDEARAALDVELDKVDGAADPAAEAFRQFAKRFEAEVLTAED